MRRIVIRVFQVTGLLLVVTIGFLAYLQYSGNFHTVAEGEVYRAAQMKPEQLGRWQAQHGIASVLNLRGENTGKDWYDAEIAAADQLGIQHIDFRMSASRKLTRDEITNLVQIMRDAPKPMLIHCQAGADRTGLASAIYVGWIKGLGESAAEWQLSLRYGHIGIPWLSKAWPMDVTWEEIEPFMGYDS